MEFYCSHHGPLEIIPHKGAIAMLLESDRNKAMEFSTGASPACVGKVHQNFLRRPIEAEADPWKCERDAGGFTRSKLSQLW